MGHQRFRRSRGDALPVRPCPTRSERPTRTGMPLGSREVAAAILDGYANGLAAPRPTLLDEQETWMRPYVGCSDKERRHFWKEVDSYPQADPPKKVAEGLERSLPKGASILRFAAPSKGGGSLGRPRYVAIAAWRGGHIVREAKALVPSAWDWAHAKGSSKSRFSIWSMAGIALRTRSSLSMTASYSAGLQPTQGRSN